RKFLSQYRRSENSILFYELTPGFDDGIYSINSLGFRDHEYTVEKDPGTFRIVVLGDSIIWGHGLPLEQTFARQLNEVLNVATRRKIEVLNFGVSGYSTQQEVELFRVKVSRFQPDLVIVGYCLNDYGESSAEKKVFLRMYDSILTRSYLYVHLQRIIRGWAYNTFGVYHEESAAQFDLRKQFRLLESYSGNAKRVVVIFPILHSFNNYLYTVEHKRVLSALEGQNYEVIDLLDHYKEYDADSLVLNATDRTHPNALGTRVAAKATMKLLLDRNLLPVLDVSTD
ncbi:MAG: SGNH/GDSL hydrolase family protein, partial [Fuerstiella sp.]